ncbi:MAG TPA: hypothetical protein VGM56_08745, partial [Byssovorax sp.]
GEHGWALLVLDPFARWAGDDAEKDNAIATRTVQASESLIRAPGMPTVLVAHHVSQDGARTGAVTARGVTGIRNGYRWEAALTPDGSDVLFRQSKSNYSRPMLDPLRCVRGEGGVLRVATPAEEAERAARVEAKADERAASKDRRRDEHAAKRADALGRRIAAAANDEWQSAAALAARAALDKNDASFAAQAAVAAGLLTEGSPAKGHARYRRPTS